MATAYLNRKTPGVYVTEIPAFGTSIVGVPTAVPVFVGYTEFAGDPATGSSLYYVPTPVVSMAEFSQYFGGAAVQSYGITPVPAASAKPATPPPASKSSAPPPTPVPAMPFSANYTTTAGVAPVLTQFTLSPTSASQFNLYWQMQLFFANGGGNCIIVSVGSYWADQFPVSEPTATGNWFAGSVNAGSYAAPVMPATNVGLLPGLYAAGYATGATMTVVPEACLLNSVMVTPEGNTAAGSPYANVVSNMLSQAAELQDRVAIIDLPGCLMADNINALTAAQTAMWQSIAPAAAAVSYGACYGPAINTTIVTTTNILFTNLSAGSTSDNAIINDILTTQACAMYGGGQLTTLQAAIAAAFPLPTVPQGNDKFTCAANNNAQYSNNAKAYPAMPAAGTPAYDSWATSLDNLLLQALPVFAQIEQLIANNMNVAPPSGILAGVWAKSDNLNGVWNAPANISLASASMPLYLMTDVEQAGFNMPTNGQAIDIIRAQQNRGCVVWGARTLDGNSGDFKYIQVRRTLIYIEQSIKLALNPYVFAANDALTWTTVTSAIASFLTGLWQQGGLMGSKPSEAFTVQCGLGSTMTAQNVLDGYMIVAVTLQMIHPAEFIELTFKQTMGS